MSVTDICCRHARSAMFDRINVGKYQIIPKCGAVKNPSLSPVVILYYGVRS